jgi:type IV secretory pathway VirB4 component
VKQVSLSKVLFKTTWLSDGLIEGPTGTFLKAIEAEPLSSGRFEEDFEGNLSETFYRKLSELLTRLPNEIDAQIIMFRAPDSLDPNSLRTKLLLFETVKRPESYSHINALLSEVGLEGIPLRETTWSTYLNVLLSGKAKPNGLPDITWERDFIRIDDKVIRALSLTELPQVTWNACLRPLFESPVPFTISMRMNVPDRRKIKRQLETKRRVSHALSISSSLEVKNIESNSVLHSSEETLERILINKETLFEISVAVLVSGTEKETQELAAQFERTVSGVGNAGLYTETVGALPVILSHLPGGKTLGIRKLPVLSENLAHLLPLTHDYSRQNDHSALNLKSRTDEVSTLNLFSKENLNFNSFICGASGSGKSFLMNAILTSALEDEPRTRICIFDIGGSYRKIIEKNGGRSLVLTTSKAKDLIKSFLSLREIDSSGFFRTFVESLCGSGSHVSHSHLVAIDDLLRECIGEKLSVGKLIKLAQSRPEHFYQDLAHWLKPHIALDGARPKEDLSSVISSQVTAFDFKNLESDPVLQRTTILMLTELLWSDLSKGSYPKTLIVFDEVWKFFARSKSFLEEMYRTLRKYRAGVVSITQNLADYGDESFAKMIFTNSFTKIFLQNGAAAEFLKDTFDLSPSDIERALSVSSKKPVYSEFFVLSPGVSQIYRLYSTPEFYELANTEDIAFQKETA